MRKLVFAPGRSSRAVPRTSRRKLGQSGCATSSSPSIRSAPAAGARAHEARARRRRDRGRLGNDGDEGRGLHDAADDRADRRRAPRRALARKPRRGARERRDRGRARPPDDHVSRGDPPHDRKDPRRKVVLDRVRAVAGCFEERGIAVALETGQGDGGDLDGRPRGAPHTRRELRRGEHDFVWEGRPGRGGRKRSRPRSSSST
mgnify:CR=1 FL=1